MRWQSAVVALIVGLFGFGGIARAQLDVTFSTARTGGRYYPAHVMAVWVTAPDGTFERTLHVWGGRRRSHLSQWLGSRTTSDSLDGITSATLRTDATQEVTWDMRDTSGRIVPDGTYVLHFELADTNSTSANYRRQLTFEKRPDGFDQTLEDSPFLQVHIVYTPVVDMGFDAGMTSTDVDAGLGTDPGTGADGRVIPIGRGYGSPGCGAAPPGGPAAPALLVLVVVGLAMARRRRG
ncbi:MAG: DUF2271 domain-containing protein [Myxococcales bacterium]|nr:DUF2271 domain-containing protein [Myxococcales bacterium]